MAYDVSVAEIAQINDTTAEVILARAAAVTPERIAAERAADLQSREEGRAAGFGALFGGLFIGRDDDRVALDLVMFDMAKERDARSADAQQG